VDIVKIKEIIVEWAENEPLVKKVYIFGSRARHDYREDSDLDVAVEINKLPGDSNILATWMFESDKLKESLEPVLPYKLQLENYDGDNTPKVEAGINQSSILIYNESSD
jgi:uncharacterized protein